MAPAARSVFFVTCARGVEPALHGEARALGLARTERQVGGVRFEGLRADAWRANLGLRTAVRVLERVARFEAKDGDQLLAGATEVPWERWLAPEGRLAVQAQSSMSALEHTQFLEQRVKDAVVDRFRARTGTRPSVDLDDPDLRIHLHLYKDRATLSLDTSGEALHKRGWRLHQGRAPLAENLAAAMLLYSEWDRRAPLVDPFAGSGTLAIEAAWLAAGIAPGSRRAFGFERWLDHDAPAFAKLRAASALEPKGKRPILLGYDLDAERVAEAQANAGHAGVGDWVRFEVADARALELKPGWNAWIASNLPYGVRVGESEDVVPLLRDFGARLRTGAQGSSLALLLGRAEHAKALGLRGLRRVPLVNGGLECELVLGIV
ncbi:MAG: RNA methyltransferase [Planctomycetes bacterium]|nr:RNA methyltransferase [Planctomycetota bacterium]